VCGEHDVVSAAEEREYGSSPRVWGTSAGGFPPASRIAGSSPRVWGTCPAANAVGAAPTVHPHVCGEHSIPPPFATVLCAVHPHVCGEHVRCSTAGSWRGGSSPRVWGTYAELPTAHPPCRFIPTCVGNIPPAASVVAIFAVHPHVCGEHAAASSVMPVSFGSSPRVWGTSFAEIERDLQHRFIPTCVGNIKSASAFLFWVSVHPHVCGEHAPVLDEIPIQTRFIPTCVGNMSPAAWVCDNAAVHPHVCGEHQLETYLKKHPAGSSPRVWGTCSRLLTRR